MGVKKGGNIVFNKDRYNDDFYLQFENQKNIELPTNIPEVNSLNDWSISWNDFSNNTSGTGSGFNPVITCVSQTQVPGVRGGWYLLYNSITRVLRVDLFVANNGNVRNFTTNLPVYNSEFRLNNFVLNYNFITNRAELYANNVFQSAINNFAPGNFISTLFTAKIGVTDTTASLYRNGGIRDLLILNREMQSDERHHLYTKESIPKSIVLDNSALYYYPLNQIPYVNGGNNNCLDFVNTHRTTPKTPTHGVFKLFTDDELGLNVGTSNFLAYGDFYTKVLGQNFSGGGDSVLYKSKELRKFGLVLNGVNQSLRILNDNPTSEKGYTTIIGYKGSASGYLMHKSNGVDEFKEEINSVNEEHVSTYPATATQETIVFPYLNTDAFESLNFVVIKQGATNTGAETDKNGSLSVNVSQQVTATGLSLGKGYNTIGGDTIIGANYLETSNFFDGSICYFARFKGVLDNEECKRLMNNRVLRNSEDISPNTKSNLDVCIDFNNPFDNGGTLQYPDLSPNNKTIVVNPLGWLNLASLEASKEEFLSLI